MSSEQRLNPNKESALDTSMSSRAMQIARRAASRTRLSYLLLDVFLGGFIVGIVLMMTLGRPPEENISEGAGGEEFMLIEFDWDNPNLTFNPVLKFNGEHIYPYGLSSPLVTDRKSVWARYDIATGKLNTQDIMQRFHSITMDGFFVERTHTLVHSDNKDKHYGYLLLSRPCPGNWSVGMRIVDESPSADNDHGYTVRFRSVCSGYEEKEDCTMDWQPLISSAKVNTSGDPFSEMEAAAGGQKFISIPVIDGEKDFDYCGGFDV